MSMRTFAWGGIAAAFLALAPVASALADESWSGRRGVHGGYDRSAGGYHRPLHRPHHGGYGHHRRPYAHGYGRHSHHGLRPIHRPYGFKHGFHRGAHPRAHHAHRGYDGRRAFFPRAVDRPAYRSVPAYGGGYQPYGYRSSFGPAYAPVHESVSYGAAYAPPAYGSVAYGIGGGINFGVPIYNRPGCTCY
jgi:hypothetical protein